MRLVAGRDSGAHSEAEPNWKVLMGHFSFLVS